MAIVHGQPFYTPPRHLQQFESDLEALPAWFCDNHDVVLTRNPVPSSFKAYMQEHGFPAPVFITSPDDLPLVNFKSFHPWGWSPAVNQVFKPFLPLADRSWSENPMCEWQPAHKELVGRQTGIAVCSAVHEILSQLPGSLIEVPSIPVKVNLQSNIKALFKAIPLPILLKTPWSASGRGLFMLLDIPDNLDAIPWVKGKLRQQGFLYAEPFLEKLRDLSFHFWCDGKGFSFLGNTWFNADSKGSFKGCYTRMPPEKFSDNILIAEVLVQAREILLMALERAFPKARYIGPVGVDAMFYFTQLGQMRLHPCIEVNSRYTMGLLNIWLSNYLHPESLGYWSIERLKASEWDDKTRTEPLQKKDGLPVSGILALSPPPQGQGYMAYLVLKHGVKQ